MTDAPLIRVLLVDDEPLARAMMREMLQDDPQVEIVGESCNGREALEAIQAHAPDLLFLDVQMPELGGFEVLASLGKRDKFPTSFLSLPTTSMPFARLRYTRLTTC